MASLRPGGSYTKLDDKPGVKSRRRSSMVTPSFRSGDKSPKSPKTLTLDRRKILKEASRRPSDPGTLSRGVEESKEKDPKERKLSLR